MKGTVSAQKAFQGSETEMKELLGGTSDNSVTPSLRTGIRRGRIRIKYANRIGSYKPPYYPHAQLMKGHLKSFPELNLLVLTPEKMYA